MNGPILPKSSAEATDPSLRLSIKQLKVRFQAGARQIHAVNGLDLSLGAGKTLALIGESGSGKSVTLRSILRLHSPRSTLIEGSIRVGAMSCNPSLLLADEPTTALDATVQIQILLLLRELQAAMNLSIVFVTHDIGAAIEVADEIAVMYAGRIVEQGAAKQIMRSPKHPYTFALLMSRAHGSLTKGERLPAIAGSPPDLARLPQGCAFAERCDRRKEVCLSTQPDIQQRSGQAVRCHFPIESVQEAAKAK
ncbi:MAG: ABC transporter ATP-binding protein [Betaproteobacteria bacterium]|nr:ABC transporter ATP-binding protein [Betaproteobacteria bacterium]